jgi:hypothetical protein
VIETTIRDPEKHETVTADSQGRVNLGVDYAAHEVELVVVESRAHRPEETGLQETIGDRPMTEAERAGMRFVRSFGLAQRFLKDDHAAEATDDGGVDPERVVPTDVDWSRGFLVDPDNVARFAFEADAPEEQFSFSDRLTEEPASVEADEIEGERVFRFENAAGGSSAVLDEYVAHVERLFGYDPTEEPSHVRVAPDAAPRPVLFRDPERALSVAVAPRVEERRD